MFRTVNSQKYWVNEIDERGGRFMESYSARAVAFLMTTLVSGIAMMVAVNVRPPMPWWASLGVFLGSAVVVMPVALFAARRLSKIGELEREGVIANTNGHAFRVLAGRLEEFDIYLERITEDRDRRVIWRLVSAYFCRVREDVVSLETGGATSADSRELQQSVGAYTSQVAELISETLKQLAQCDRFVQTCNDQMGILRAKLADGPMSGELRASILASAERQFG